MTREAVDLLRALAEEKDQRLDVEVDGTLLVRGDRNTLRQAVLNLVDNAIKYTPRGGTIRVRARGDDARDVIVEVTDDGPGISAEHRERVFERFYRVEEDRSRATGGAGLGLAIARWAVELNGGRIELDSALGKGSTFRMRIPRETSPALTVSGPTINPSSTGDRS